MDPDDPLNAPPAPCDPLLQEVPADFRLFLSEYFVVDPPYGPVLVAVPVSDDVAVLLVVWPEEYDPHSPEASKPPWDWLA